MPALDERAAAPGADHRDRGHRASLAEQRFDRSLVQMATGAGKTFTAVTECLPAAQARRVQPDPVPGRPQQPGRPDAAPSSRTTAPPTTAAGSPSSTTSTSSPAPGCSDPRQRGDLHDPARLQGAAQRGGRRRRRPGLGRLRPRRAGRPSPTTRTCRRRRSTWSSSTRPTGRIYGVWRGVLEYFDAHVVGLTATPGKQTFGFFQQNLVSEYTYPQSVADRSTSTSTSTGSSTEISEQGSNDRGRHDRPEGRPPHPRPAARSARRGPRVHPAGSSTGPSPRRSRSALVLETFRDRLFTEIFPGRRRCRRR